MSDPAVHVVIDTSLMTGVSFDARLGAFVVEAGATLGEVYRKLFLGWGVTLPAGISPDIGIGGHVLGGAFGFLSRQHGLAADHLYAIEVVVVDAGGTARSVLATREPADPNHDLWWAHTGGGGGNFGIVTRYWFRSPGAAGSDPAGRLPKAPASVLRFKATWQWEAVDASDFVRLLHNHGDWCERNSEPGSVNAGLYSTLVLGRRPAGAFELTGVITAGDAPQLLLDEYLAALQAGVRAAHRLETDRVSWLAFALHPFPDLVASGAVDAIFKIKDAFLRRRLSDGQIETVFNYLTRTDHDVPGGGFGLANYGGQINAAAPDATASAERSAIITMSCSAGWQNPSAEAQSLAWLRQFYRDLFSATGGVPVPGAVTGGAFINHPDVDLADPAWNTSGVPWSTLYYQGNYPRLQQIKTRWDPLNIFHHALSIQPV